MISLSETVRKEFVSRLNLGEPLEGLLAACLKIKVAFDKQDITFILKLLESPQPKTRFAAIGALAPNYLSRSEIRAYAQKLIEDPYQHLRDKGIETLATYRDLQSQY